MSDSDLHTDEQSASGRLDQTYAYPEIAEWHSRSRGQAIGRYIVLHELGAGAMGVVLAAYDPELDRKVALKLLKTRDDPTGRARKRLQKEAQALAKLNHRNVVAVHDVGVHEAQLFVAMEFVKGQTLWQWMTHERGPRPWDEVLRVFAEAGRGLAAAHQVGLVHRDFKPDNVMIGEDGQVRVMDFGLARSDNDGLEDEPHQAAARLIARDRAQVDRLTRTGALLGSPAYMSPEQFERIPATAASDQFSFCVALYEGLYAERPFAGDTLPDLLKSVIRGEIQPAPKRSLVPGWVRKVIVQGLATRPEERHPSMEALLDALAADPRTRRRRRLLAGAVAGALIGGGFGLYGLIAAGDQTCARMEDHLDGVWDDQRRAEVEAAIEGTHSSYASETWTRVEKRLDEYTAAWVHARTEACNATRRGEQSDELLDRRMVCLDKRLAAVRALVKVLANADADVVQNAVTGIAGLAKVEDCSDFDALMAAHPLPRDPIAAARVKAQDQRLGEIEGLEKAGEFREGLSEINTVVAEAHRLEYEPLLVRALLLQGALHKRAGGLDVAVKTLERAYELAVDLGMVDDAASCAAHLVYVVGVDLAKFDEARRWATIAEPLARLAGEEAALGVFHYNWGIVAMQQGQLDEARHHLTRSLAIDEKTLSPDHPSVGVSLFGLGNLEYWQGHSAQAAEYFRRALDVLERALGPEHPNVASVVHNLGAVAYEEKKYDEALEYFERGFGIRQRALAPHAPEIIESLVNLGNVADAMGDADRAQRYAKQALALVEEHMGGDHPYAGMILGNLATLAFDRGALEDARRDYERAIAIFESKLEETHPHVALTVTNLANVAELQGELNEARVLRERAVAIIEANHGPEHADLGEPLVGLGDVARKQGRYDDALAHYERALTVHEGDSAGGSAKTLARAQFGLAQLLWSAEPSKGQDRPRALALARLASESAAAEHRAEVEAWLAAHAAAE